MLKFYICIYVLYLTAKFCLSIGGHQHIRIVNGEFSIHIAVAILTRHFNVLVCIVLILELRDKSIKFERRNPAFIQYYVCGGISGNDSYFRISKNLSECKVVGLDVGI